MIENGITEGVARDAYAKLGEWDKEKIAGMVDKLRLLGLAEGKSLALLGAIGAKMVTEPDHLLWDTPPSRTRPSKTSRRRSMEERNGR